MNRGSAQPAVQATDEELDRDWKPSGRRPQSTIARSFSQELMDIFRIENSVADLDEQVDKRKQQLNTRTNELEALEARIREMEQRLKTQKPNPTTGTSFASLSAAAGPSQPSRPQQLPLNPREQPDSSSSPAHSPRRARVPVGSAFDQPQDRPQPTPPQQQQQQQYARRPAPLAGKPPSRGSTGGARASQQAVPGALPPTPGASEDGDDDDAI